MGSIKLFKVLGITVFLDWTWFLLASYEVQSSKNDGRYSNLGWHIIELLSIFVIVLLHEFGHALACRSVGGTADRIVLWPLGGIAYVQPPMRPGAMLWSIAAGPLVNVVLLPVFFGAFFLSDIYEAPDDVQSLCWALFAINTGILIFNVLPIYPLDGGQILQSLLWFILGYARSLRAATTIGIVGAAALGLYALSTRHYWTVMMAAFIGYQCWQGIQISKRLIEHETLGYEQPRWDDDDRH
jgi:Zn-dependent protease